jgi:hypothetical protein
VSDGNVLRLQIVEFELMRETSIKYAGTHVHCWQPGRDWPVWIAGKKKLFLCFSCEIELIPIKFLRDSCVQTGRNEAKYRGCDLPILDKHSRTQVSDQQ